MPGPLEGLTVIDLTTMVAGPWATDLLGDQGADVIKVEVPGTGDHTRQLRNQLGGLSSSFVNVNRSKRSLTLHLKTPGGRAVFRRLAARADVLVQNFRPGVVERLGISYQELVGVNPGLVYVSISGFGETGPLAGARAYDPIVQALSGLTTIQAGADDRRPALVRTIVPDKLTAITAAQAACAALVARGRTGRGQHVRLSMLDSVLAFLWASDYGGQTFVDHPVQPQQAASFIDLIYQTADGHMTVSTMGDSEWRGFCRAVERPDWLKDPRFASPAARDEHVDARLELVQSALRGKTTAEWLDIFTRHDVPCAPAQTRSQVLSHPQVLASGSLIESEHPTAGRLRQARSAPRYEATPSAPPRGAPLLGEHTGEILAELGYDPAEIQALIAQGVVGAEDHGGQAAQGEEAAREKPAEGTIAADRQAPSGGSSPRKLRPAPSGAEQAVEET